MYHKIIFFFLSVLVFFSCSATQQVAQTNVPQWIENESRNKLYSSDVYLRGYSMSTKLEWEKLDDFLERISNLARKELLESIQAEIKNESILQVEETISYGNSNISSKYKTQSQSTSRFEIANVVIDKFLNEKTKIGYAFAFVKRADVIRFYSNDIADRLKKIDAANQESERYFSTQQYQKALQIAAQALPLFNEMNTAKNILNALKVIDEDMTHTKKINEVLILVNQNISKSINAEQIVLSSQQLNYTTAYRQPIEKPFLIQAHLQSNGTKTQARNLPLVVVQDTIIYCRNNTNQEGETACAINAIKSKKSLQYFNAILDVATYLSIPQSIADLPIFKPLCSPLQFTVQLQKAKIYIDGQDNKTTSQTTTTFLQTKLKALFGEYDFVFVPVAEQADYVVSCNSNETVSNNGTELVFVYVSATLRIFGNKQQAEIYSNTYSNIKGVGIDANRASALAKKKTYESVEEDLKKNFLTIK